MKILKDRNKFEEFRVEVNECGVNILGSLKFEILHDTFNNNYKRLSTKKSYFKLFIGFSFYIFHTRHK